MENQAVGHNEASITVPTASPIKSEEVRTNSFYQASKPLEESAVEGRRGTEGAAAKIKSAHDDVAYSQQRSVTFDTNTHANTTGGVSSIGRNNSNEPGQAAALAQLPINSLVFPNYALYQQVVAQQRELETLRSQLADSHEREQRLIGISGGLQDMVSRKTATIETLEDDKARLRATVARQSEQIATLSHRVEGLQNDLERIYGTVGWHRGGL